MKKLILLLLLIAASVNATSYVDSTLGVVQQALGCNYCGVQRPASGIGGPSIYLGRITASNTGYLDSLEFRASSNGTVVKFCGVVYDGTTSLINNFIVRSIDSAAPDNSVNMATYRVRFTPNIYQLTSGAVYYVGGFTDSTNTSTVRYAYQDDTTSTMGTQDGATAVANWTTAGYTTATHAFVHPYVRVYYHSGGGATTSSTVIRGSVIRGSVIR